jgi:hypothetical protein
MVHYNRCGKGQSLRGIGVALYVLLQVLNKWVWNPMTWYSLAHSMPISIPDDPILLWSAYLPVRVGVSNTCDMHYKKSFTTSINCIIGGIV